MMSGEEVWLFWWQPWNKVVSDSILMKRMCDLQTATWDLAFFFFRKNERENVGGMLEQARLTVSG